MGEYTKVKGSEQISGDIKAKKKMRKVGECGKREVCVLGKWTNS